MHLPCHSKVNITSPIYKTENENDQNNHVGQITTTNLTAGHLTKLFSLHYPCAEIT